MSEPTAPIYPATVPEAAAASVGGLAQHLPSFPDELCHHVGDECQIGDNTARAGFAAHGLVAHARRTGQLKTKQTTGEILTNADFETGLGDLVANLRHLCDAADVSWDAVLDRAALHYRAELAGA